MVTVIGVPSFWRWRLMRDGDPQQFDRFWQQLMRYLSEGCRADVVIRLPDQDLRPQSDVRLQLVHNPRPGQPPGASRYQVRMLGAKQHLLRQLSVNLSSQQPVEVSFRPVAAGVCTMTVSETNGALVATRAIEVRETNLEFRRAGRDMDRLKQWASLTDGLAVKVEDIRDTSSLMEKIKRKAGPLCEPVKRASARRFQRRGAGVVARMPLL